MSLKALNDSMQEGYKLSMEGDAAGACDVWMETWQGIEREMEERGIKTVEQFDPIFDGEQLIVNWGPRFEMELHSAALDDRSYARMCIEFCGRYAAKMQNPDSRDSLNMRRAMAEAHYKLGDSREGEAIFRRLTEEHPAWAWGWIGWAEEYGSYGEIENRDARRGIEILKRALAAEGLEERIAVMERLEDLYIEAGMTEDAEKVAAALRRETAAISSVPSAKVGRNDPCPCGSGKKYKKCCGV